MEDNRNDNDGKLLTNEEIEKIILSEGGWLRPKEIELPAFKISRREASSAGIVSKIIFFGILFFIAIVPIIKKVSPLFT